MSEASTDRVADRPAEVTDPLLWDLAAAVADAHQPDAERACASPSCAGAAWPCPAWNNAQVGLSAARAPQPARSVPAARSVSPGGAITSVGVLTPGLAGTVPVAPADRQHAQPGAGDAADRLAAATAA
ncbi:hypothetical protein ACFFKH_06100 [Micromonospora marina]|uniref:Uncharacterized protein n=1 Tax=Micromonospora marina TaxID=307120 RepID=A0A1C4W861_9ACTN|nr:hypothetical protein [Micromonospora marina]SCE92417.1 hypothetical protein GA0070215_104301 [Micromonospora marina]